MNIYINSPSYYTQEYGVIDDIYKMCSLITRNINIKHYTEAFDTIGITPIIAPNTIIVSGAYCEVKYFNLSLRLANISLHSDYDSFVKGDIMEKKRIILDNILKSLKVVEKKIKICLIIKVLRKISKIY